MSYEGEDRLIELRGIERAGVGRRLEAGGLEECVGLEYKNGVLVPYQLKSVGNLPNTNIKQVYIHKTSDGDVAVVLFKSGNVYYQDYSSYVNGDRVITEAAPVWSDVTEIYFIGNVMVNQRMEALAYYNGQYNFWPSNISRSDLPRVMLRVRSDYVWEGDASLQQVGSGSRLQMCEYTIRDSYYTGSGAEAYVGKDYLNGTDVGSTNKSVLSGLASKVMNAWSELGGLTGYVFAVVAYRLVSGEYVLASQPLLLGPPDLVQENNRVKLDTGNTDNLYDLSDGWRGTLVPREWAEDRSYDYSGVTYQGIYSSKHYPYDTDANNHPVYNKMYYQFLSNDNRYFIAETQEWSDDVAIGNNGYTNKSNVHDYYYRAPSLIGWMFGFHGNDYVTAVLANANVLEYKIDSDISERYRDSIKSVCIFLSEQVSPWKSFENANITNFGQVATRYSSGTPNANNISANYLFAVKSGDKIKEELFGLKNFYRVAEIDYSDIKESNDWIKVDLRGKLGDNLLVLPTLNLSAFGKNDILYGHGHVYNQRLHIYDYEQQVRYLPDINDLLIEAGYGQYIRGVTTQSSPQIKKWEIHALCKSNEIGEYEVVTHGETLGENNRLAFSGILTYPNESCYRMIIVMQVSCNVTGVPKKTIMLVYEMDDWGDLVMSRSKVINFADNYIYPNFIPFSENFEFQNFGWATEDSIPSRHYKNRLRVSSAESLYFPVEQSYTIGKSGIIGLSEFNLPLASYNYGRVPLIVFTGDGIYGMEIDSTGLSAYSHIDNLSDDVCLSGNCITKIGGSVIYATISGLKIFGENGANRICVHTIGNQLFTPSLLHGSGRKAYKRILDTYSIPVPSNDFLSDLSTGGTVITSINHKDALLIYNSDWGYTYLVKLQEGVLTCLPCSIGMHDGNSKNRYYYDDELCRYEANVDYDSNAEVKCLLLTRTIEVSGGVFGKLNRVVLRGYFKGTGDAYLLVLGSLDDVNWHILGYSKRSISGGIVDIGARTDRSSIRYMRVLFAGKLKQSSHIDRLEINYGTKYNNKLK